MASLTHGKYLNHTFEEVLSKDLPYCQFMASLKFVKPHFKEFVDFLKVNLPIAEEAERQRKIAAIV